MNILLLGAGRTAHFLIEYLVKRTATNNWTLTVADYSSENYKHFLQWQSSKVSFQQLDVQHEDSRQLLVENSDAVISLLPAVFHHLIAQDCLKFGKHFFTASYVSDDIKAMADDVREKGLFFLMETGLDPGIDHMSAMEMLDEIRDEGGSIKSFLSYTGGLMSPDLAGNPWEYKFTWNPEYVVTAGRDGGMYLRNKNIKRIPYHRLFKEIDELDIPKQGRFDAYYNRNSLKYIDEYGLKDVETVIRYTLRRAGFCNAWHPLVALGMTDNLHEFSLEEPITNRDFLNFFVRSAEGSLRERTAKAINKSIDSTEFSKLEWLGLFDDAEIPIRKGTSAKFLQKILEPKWGIQAGERDAIYMAHVCYFMKDSQLFKKKAYLAVEGDDSHKTAMAKTVGLPLAIATSLVLEGTIKGKGLFIPTSRDIYQPILQELRSQHIRFEHITEEK